ncbi:2191_t:CDS:2, partial [Paraglomus brasilianum]
LCEIKLAQELSEVNLVRRLIVETHFLKAPKGGIPVVTLTKQKTGSKKSIKQI